MRDQVEYQRPDYMARREIQVKVAVDARGGPLRSGDDGFEMALGEGTCGGILTVFLRSEGARYRGRAPGGAAARDVAVRM